MTRRLPPAVLALILLALAGCGPEEPTAPLGHEKPTAPLVVIAGPKAFSSFELLDDDGGMIWRLVADEPAPLDEVYYGEIPAGFRQETPADQSGPRQLQLGEWVRLRSETPRRIFHHEGFVDSDQRLSLESWAMELRNPPPVAELDAAAAAP